MTSATTTVQPAGRPGLLLKHLPFLLLIAAVFLASVWVRSPYLFRPISYAYEWLTAHTLIVHRSWDVNGLAASYLAQNMTFERDADRHINNAAQSNYSKPYPEGPNGHYYYLSHPVGGVLAPYLTFKLLGVASNPRTIRIFNLALQFVCAVFLYIIFVTLVEPGWQARLAASLAAAAYTWLPANLWFHSNVYFVEIFLQLPFIVSAWLLVHYIKSGHGRGWLIGLAAGIFFMAFTEWTGVLAAGCLFLWAVARPGASRDWPLAIAMVAACTLALGVFFLQSALVVGPVDFLKHLYHQFAYRSYPGEEASIFARADFTKAMDNFRLGALPALWLLAIMLAASLGNRQDWRAIRPLLPAMAFLGVPVLLHNAILSGYNSTHWYSILKAMPLLCLALAAMLFVLLRQRQRSRMLMPILAGLVLFAGYRSHVEYKLNYVAYGGDPRHYAVLGHLINRDSEPDEVVFLRTPEPIRPQLVYYARKNLKQVTSLGAARQWLSEHGKPGQKAIIFYDIGAHRFERFVNGEPAVPKSETPAPDDAGQRQDNRSLNTS